MDNIDNNFLHYFGSVKSNSLTHVLKVDINSIDDKIHTEPNIIG